MALTTPLIFVVKGGNRPGSRAPQNNRLPYTVAPETTAVAAAPARTDTIPDKPQEISPGEAMDSMVMAGGTSIVATDSAAAADQHLEQNPRRHRINRLLAWDRLCTVLRLNGLACVAYGGVRYLTESVLTGAITRPYAPAGAPGVFLMMAMAASTVWAIPSPREIRLWG